MHFLHFYSITVVIIWTSSNYTITIQSHRLTLLQKQEDHSDDEFFIASIPMLKEYVCLFEMKAAWKAVYSL